MVETYTNITAQPPYIEKRAEQLLASVYGDPQAARKKDAQGNFTETEEDIVEAMESNVKEDGSSYSKDEVIKIFEEDYQLTPEK